MNKPFGIVIILFSCLFISCGQELNTPEWKYSEVEIIGKEIKKTDKLSVDIYLDGTTSMKGFSKNDQTQYSQFLDQLEASANQAWKNADIQFYKFGTGVKSIDRFEFLQAKTAKEFYQDPDIYEKTLIDNAIDKTDDKRLSIVITDLFQDESDVNSMVLSIKQKCFDKNIKMGIALLQSEFDGMVFDVPNYPKGFRHIHTARPFYVLLFGNYNNMDYMFNALKVKSFIKEDKVLVISNNLLKKQNIAISKTNDSKDLVRTNQSSEDLENNKFNFTIREEGVGGKFNLEINLDRNTRTPDFDVNKLELISYKISGLVKSDRSQIQTDSVLCQDFKLENVKRLGNKITGTLSLASADIEGKYSYLIYLKVADLDGLIVPNWIKSNSTDIPIQGTPSANLTYNLEKLVSRLLVANSTINPVYMSKFYISINKQ